MCPALQWIQIRSVATATVVQRVVEVLAGGGVIVAPTETVYGLMCRWNDDAARERIFRMKCRTPEKHLQMLADSLDRAQGAGLLADDRLRRLATAFWPGPLTVVGKGPAGSTIGLRIPRYPLILEIMRTLGCPLAATSANLSGRPAALDAEGAIADLAEPPDLVLDGGPVAADGGQSSTVVDLSLPGAAQVRRLGPISAAAVRRALGEPAAPTDPE
jgi:L-threonylcarbamoyladenylate synthase